MEEAIHLKDAEKEPIHKSGHTTTYNTILQRVRSASLQSSTHPDLLCKAFNNVFFGTACSIVYLVFSFGLPISMLVIGAIYFKDCPAEPYIPIYLVVAGAGGILVAIINTIFKCSKRIHRRNTSSIEEESKCEEETQQCSGINPFLVVLNVFLFAWFIAGNYWVFHIYDSRSDNLASKIYCYDVLYLFAFWLIIAGYISLLLALCWCAGLTGMLCCLTKVTKD